MGLTLCKKIVEGEQGHIECFSGGPQKGSTFAFSMSMNLPEKSQNGLSVIQEMVTME